jgi:sugar O-acyltransferase (sialic acid O-acetyltransferase NeuD family)
MKQLIIIGAGGMGRCTYCIAEQSVGFGVDFQIKGFLDDNIHALDGFDGYKPVLATIAEYKVEPEDVFVCSIGEVQTKSKICEWYKAKGATFYTLIHKKSSIGKNTKIGIGTIIDEGVHIDPDVTIGTDCLIQAQAIIGHDSIIGNYSRVDTLCSLVGGTIVKDRVTIYTHSMINHNVTIGEDAVVGACSFVIKNVKPGVSVFGVPAKKLF